MTTPAARLIAALALVLLLTAAGLIALATKPASAWLLGGLDDERPET